MLTKYQMIKFIDFCEVWFLPKSVVGVAAIVGDHSCHTPRYWFKETLDVFLGHSRPSSFHTFPKLIWCGSWGCNLGQPCTTCFPSAKNPESDPTKEAIQSGDWRRTLGQCVPRVVAHYPVEIWLWASPEGKEGQLAPTPRRCSAGCLQYR